MFGSYVFDWYVVIPRRDGLIVAPPCMSQEDWAALTRAWYVARGLSGVAAALAVVVATAGLTHWAVHGASLTDVQKAATLVLTAGGVGFSLTRLLYGNLTTIGTVISTCCLSAPDIRLGDRLIGPGEDFKGGYVRDVSLEGDDSVREWLPPHQPGLFPRAAPVNSGAGRGKAPRPDLRAGPLQALHRLHQLLDRTRRLRER